MEIFAATDVGRVRERNEDAFCVRTFPHLSGAVLLAVADGMGGHMAGDVASRLAVETIQEILSAPPAPEQDPPDPATLLVESVREANRRIFRESLSRPEQSGMGTTLTALLIAGDRLVVAHVGDSRAYLLREGHLQQLTQDHSLVGEMVRSGEITEGEASSHPQRHLLTRALGPEPEAVVDRVESRLHPGDLLVLATDGLTGVFEAPELQGLLDPSLPVEGLASRLVEAANRRGGSDNVTVIVAKV